MASSIEDILAEAEDSSHRRTATARVLIRQDLAARHAELEQELADAVADDAKLNRTPQAPKIAAAIEALQTEMESLKVPFLFRAVGRRRWADMLAKHPPTKEQRKLDQRIDHDPEKFPITAIAASCVDPEMTVDDVYRLEAELNQTQFDKLWAACLDANLGGGEAPKSLAAGVILRANGQYAHTAALEESLEASSSDG